MLAKLLIIIGLVATGLLFILMTTTTPTSAGAGGILGVFLLSYTVFVCGFSFVIWGLAKVYKKVISEFRRRSAGQPMTLKKSYYYSSIVSLGPIIIISLQSVGGVGIYEVSLVIAFIVLGCLYVARRAA